MMLKRVYLLFTFILVFAFTMQSVNFREEKLNYQIVYHWGLIWKHAASATLEIKDGGRFYEAKLSARTLSWVDNIYKVRDTLSSSIDKNRFVPVKYIKTTHEKKHDGKDIVDFFVKNGITTGYCTRIRPGKDDFKITLTADGPAYDMLSVFYWLRNIDMGELAKNKTFSVTVFSGKRKERLDVTYVCEERVKMRDKSHRDAYHIKFKFTEDGKNKSSDDIDTWISTDESRIPLLLKGSLPIGEVRVYYRD